IPRTNLYSFTHPGYEVTPTHWAFGLGAYLVHEVFDVNGLVVLKALFAAGAFTLVYLLARKRGAGAIAAAAVVTLGVLASRKRFLERPHMFTMLGLAGFAYLIALIRDARRPGSTEGPDCPDGRGRRRLVWVILVCAIPVLAMLWANLHAGCLFGVGLVAFEAAGEGVTWLWRRSRSGPEDPATARARSLMLLFGAAALASAVTVMLTPAGWVVYAYNFWHVGLDEVVVLNEFVMAKPLAQPFFYVLLVTGVVALAVEWRKVRPAEPIALVAFAALAVYAVRGIPNLALVAVPAIAPRLSGLWQRAGTLRYLTRAKGYLDGVRPMVVSTVVGVALIAFPFACHLVSWQYPIGLGVARDFVPEGSAGFIEREVESPRVFNDLASGGYLIWRWHPGRQVFFDGRTNAYPREFIKSVCKFDEPDPDTARELAGLPRHERLVLRGRMMRERFEDLLESHDTNCALILHRPGGNRFWPAFDLDRWAVVYAEEAALVLARRTAQNRELIEKHENKLGARGEAVLSRRLGFRSRLLTSPSMERDAAGAGEAAARALAAEAASGRSVFEPRRRSDLYVWTGVRAQLAGDPRKAAAAYRKALELGQAQADVHINLGFALLDLGKPRAARLHFELVLTREPAKPYALYGLAGSLERLGYRKASAAAYRRFLAGGGGRPNDIERAKKALGSLGQ
ncbi:MAG: hypothetical protein ACYTFI_11535, partial [Planctomycetota bacterium]